MNEKKNATKILSKLAFKAFKNKSKSPRQMENDIATLGPSMGAMTMAPINTTELSLIKPIAATIADNTTMTN